MVRPTVQGKALYEASRSALSIIDAALEGVRHKMGAIEGLLRVHAPSCIGVRHLHPITLAFQERYPDVTIDLVLENRAIDLIHEGFDLALRYGRPDGQELIVRRLGLVRRILVAAPGFIERSGPVETPARLSEIDIVTTPTLLSPRDVLSLRRGGESVDVPVRPVMRTNTAETIVATLLSGRAAGPVQQLLVGEEMAAGRLVRILPDYEVKPTEAFWTFPSVRFMRPVVRAFTDFAIPALRAVEGIDAGDMRSEAA